MTSVHYLVADDGQELPVLVVGLRGGHGDGTTGRAERPASFSGGEGGAGEGGRFVKRRPGSCVECTQR